MTQIKLLPSPRDELSFLSDDLKQARDELPFLSDDLDILKVDLEKYERNEHRTTRDFILQISHRLAKHLFEKLEYIKNQNTDLSNLLTERDNQLASVLDELNFIKEERERKTALKEARAKRKRQQKRQPITYETYQLIIQSIDQKNYNSARLRIAFCLLLVTGIRINELLPLKVYQIETLCKYHWIAISRSKRGPSNHKAFLTKEGKRIVDERAEDFKLISLMKKSDSYIFTSDSKHDQMLRRETLTRAVNNVMKAVSKKLSDNPRITSHSFRSGYITQLWKDTKDIEFVRQAIGHARLDTTSSYIKNLTDQERQKRMLDM